MSFQDDFADRVATLRREALDHFQDFGLVRPGTRETIAHLSEDKARVVVDIELDPISVERLQGRLDQIRSDLDMFEIRVEQYLDLDRGDLGDLRDKLCRRDITHLGAGGWGVSMGPPPERVERPTNVTDRIDIAATHYVLRMGNPPMLTPPVWEGDAATAFNENFLVPFGGVAARQIFAGVYLGNVLQIFQNLVKGVQHDLLAIADSAINAFNDDVEYPISAGLSDGALFLDLTSFILPPPMDMAAGITSVSMDILSRQVTDPEPPEWLVQWNLFTEDIIVDTFGLLDRLEEEIRAKDGALGDAIKADSAWWEFSLVGSAPDPPDRLDGDLVAELETIYEFGKRLFPSAADLYQEAALKVEFSDLPDWFNRPFTNSWCYYEAARQALQAGLNQTTEQLLSAGQGLIEICESYAIEDDAAAALLAAVKDALPPPEDVTPLLGRGSRAHPL